MGHLPQKEVVMSARLHSWPQAIAGSTGNERWRVSKAGGAEGSNGRLTDRWLDASRVSVNSSRSSAREESGQVMHFKLRGDNSMVFFLLIENSDSTFDY